MIQPIFTLYGVCTTTNYEIMKILKALVGIEATKMYCNQRIVGSIGHRHSILIAFHKDLMGNLYLL